MAVTVADLEVSLRAEAFTTIWKYDVGALGIPFERQMPEGALYLDMQSQAGRPVMWFGVNPDEPRVTRWFLALGTGWQVPDTAEYDYLGTVQHGSLVLHVFEIEL